MSCSPCILLAYVYLTQLNLSKLTPNNMYLWPIQINNTWTVTYIFLINEFIQFVKKLIMNYVVWMVSFFLEYCFILLWNISFIYSVPFSTERYLVLSFTFSNFITIWTRALHFLFLFVIPSIQRCMIHKETFKRVYNMYYKEISSNHFTFRILILFYFYSRPDKRYRFGIPNFLSVCFRVNQFKVCLAAS